jgi:NAD(P)H-dependent FMN reductase
MHEGSFCVIRNVYFAIFNDPIHLFMNITVVSGSPRPQSVTRRVAIHLKGWLENHTDHSIQMIDMQEWNLPPMVSVFPSIKDTPEAYRPLAEVIFDTDAFILVTPEYNGSYSPSLKNMLDHFPKQERKTFGIVTASTGALGGMRAAQQMLLLIPALFGISLPQLLIVPQVEKKFDPKGILIDTAFQKNIDVFTREFLWLSEQISTPKEIHSNSLN